MITLIFFLLFTAAMIGIGVWGMKQTTSIKDYFLAGRGLGPWLVAISYGVSYFSAVVFIGFAGKLGWLFGMDVMWVALGNTLFGAGLAWLVLGRRTRRMSHRLDAMTMPEFFEARYQAPSMKLIAAIITFFFLLPYSAGVFKGLGHLFEVNFGISYLVAVIIMTALTGIYLVLGGYKASSRTDFLQGGIMILGCIAVLGAFLHRAGGSPSELVGSAVAGYREHSGTFPPGTKRTVLLWSLVFMTSFGTWGLPQMVQKYYAIKDEKMIPRGALVTTLFAVLVVGTAYFVGALSHGVIEVVPEGGNFDMVVPAMLKIVLPEVLLALFLLLILSASMSTLASLVLVSASAIVIDVWKVHRRDEISQSRQVHVMRGLTLLFIVLSLVLALVAEKQLQFIVDLISLSWGTVAGAFMAPYLYGLYWRRTTKAGAMAGLLVGLTTALVLFFVWDKKMFPVSATIAMLVPFVVVPIVSLLTKPPAAEVIALAFDGVGAAPDTDAEAAAIPTTGGQVGVPAEPDIRADDRD